MRVLRLNQLLVSRDANAVAAAVLADLSPGKGLEEEIEAELGTGACKVWKEMKLLLQPQGKCENKEHIAGKEDGEEEFVCEEADCLLLWLEDKTFSVSARTALMAWALLLARSKQSSLIFPPSALQEQVISTLRRPPPASQTKHLARANSSKTRSPHICKSQTGAKISLTENNNNFFCNDISIEPLVLYDSCKRQNCEIIALIQACDWDPLAALVDRC